MRLLKRGPDGDLSLTRDLIDDIPAYAILSHTWGAEDDEVDFHDVEGRTGEGKAGYTKLQFCGKQAEKDGLQYFWIDTCCINRANHVELSEAITSMYRWYRGAAKCYVYLSNVSATGVGDDEAQSSWEAAFHKSRWWRRGWTLQELLAPASVEFFSREGMRLGNKRTLEGLVQEITKIPVPALRGEPLSRFSVDERLRWAAGRNTKRPEDNAYCLLGLFNVYMPLIYGEGDNAFVRLKEEIGKLSISKQDLDMTTSSEAGTSDFGDTRSMTSDISSIDVSDKISDWLSSTDPKARHEKASKSRAGGTGTWFLKRDVFKQWASLGGGALFWLRGITGAGKTTLMSLIIDELARLPDAEATLAYFYYSFDDKDNQSLTNVFGSILAQLSAQNQWLSQELSAIYLQRLSETRGKPKPLPLEQIIEIILRFSQRHGPTFIAIDAINEASEPFLVLETLKSLATSCTIIISSVNSPGFNEFLRTVPRLKKARVHASDIQEDVEIYVRTFLESHYRMRGLSSEVKGEILRFLTSSNEGMFRWVQCQLVRLADLKTAGQIRAALAGMPVTLDKTYEDLLLRIEEGDKELAKEVLLLLTSCLRPLTLREISAALQITPGLARLDENKLLLYPMDVVNVCNGLVRFDEVTRIVSLAHHSVKTYLTSSNLTGRAAYFHLVEDDADQQFAERCLTYLSFDAFAGGPLPDKSSLKKRMESFPFLGYATFHWALHAQRVHLLAPSLSMVMQTFFTNPASGQGNFLAWVQILLPEFQVRTISKTQPLYYAASFGLTRVVEFLVANGADLEAHGGRHGATALGVASYRGNADAVKVLLEAGADPHRPDRGGLDAVDWARNLRRDEVLKILENHLGGGKG